MQVAPEGFTAEERDSVRSVAHNLLVSWKKQTNLSAITFTIGVSLIGGDDVIGINPGAIGSAGNYYYFDESDYVMAMNWERGLNMPTGGLSKAYGEALLSNTSGRFTPRYMGGDSELFTSVLPRRPFIINAGFNYGGIDQTLPQLTGVTTKQLEIDKRAGRARLQGADYIDFFQNRYLDQTTIFTGQRTDEVIESLLSQLGMSTAQYDLDTGISIIPFGMFPKGSRYSDVINDLVEAENGQFYQDEEGKFKFDNRQHWDSSPYNEVQKVVLTGQVINAQMPNTDHIINVVEVKSDLREKQPEQTVFRLPALTSLYIPANSNVESFFEFEDPVLELTDPTSDGTTAFYKANTSEDGTGTNVTSSISIENVGTFANAVKYRFRNNSSSNAYVTQFVLSGRVGKKTGELYHRAERQASVTAYEERPFVIDNDFIQDINWAESYAQMILNDFAYPENLQKITVRAMPSLQLGDLVSWQGNYWRIYNIRSQLDPSVGFTQELTLLQRDIIAYFRIGISTIGGTDQIAP